MSEENNEAKNQNAFLQKLAEHEPATIRTSDDIVFVKADEGIGSNEASPRAPSALQSKEKHRDKHSVSTRAAFESAHNKTSTTGSLGHLLHLKPLKPIQPIAPKPQLKPLK